MPCLPGDASLMRMPAFQTGAGGKVPEFSFMFILKILPCAFKTTNSFIKSYNTENLRQTTSELQEKKRPS